MKRVVQFPESGSTVSLDQIEPCQWQALWQSVPLPRNEGFVVTGRRYKGVDVCTEASIKELFFN